MPSTSVNAAVFLEILDEIPADQLDPRHRAMFHRSHALARLGIAKTTAVIRELETALRIAEPLREPRLLSWILAPLGYYLGNSGRMAAAERILLRNLRLMESEGSPTDKADALFMLALVYDRQGDHGLAKKYWRLALAEARRTGNRRLVLEFSTWPVAFPSDLQTMLPRLRKWRTDFRRWGMPRHVAAMDLLAGEILCREERYRAHPRESHLRKAIGLLQRAVTGCDAVGNPYEGCYARSWLALALCLAEEYDKARAEAEAILESGRKIGPTAHCSILGHQVLSRVCRFRGDMVAALKHSDEAVRLAHRMHCGCQGIALLERAMLRGAPARDAAWRRALDQAVSETLRRGYPDEVRYARRVGRQHHHATNREPHDTFAQSGHVAAGQTAKRVTAAVST